MFYNTDGKADGPAWVKLSIQKLIDFFEVLWYTGNNIGLITYQTHARGDRLWKTN